MISQESRESSGDRPGRAAHLSDTLCRIHCRYGARGALSLERLSRREDGTLAYRMKRPTPAGHASAPSTESRRPPPQGTCRAGTPSPSTQPKFIGPIPAPASPTAGYPPYRQAGAEAGAPPRVPRGEGGRDVLLIKVGQQIKVPAVAATPEAAATRAQLKALVEDMAKAEGKLWFGGDSVQTVSFGNTFMTHGPAESGRARRGSTGCSLPTPAFAPTSSPPHRSPERTSSTLIETRPVLQPALGAGIARPGGAAPSWRSTAAWRITSRWCSIRMTYGRERVMK